MSKIWLIILLSSITTLMFSDPSLAVKAMIQGSHDSVSLAISLVALYGFWLGFFAILEKTGISAFLAKILKPVVRFLFPGENKETEKFITLNISANILGLGNAATPMAISAIGSMHDGKSEKATLNMIMLMVLSSTSLQLLPTTVIGMRASHNSANPSDFLLPCMIATVCSTVIGVILVKVYGLIRKKLVLKSKKPKEPRGITLPKSTIKN